MIDWLRNLLKSAYTKQLEAECARLRAENRALLNSLLGTAGFPPVQLPEAIEPAPRVFPRGMSWQQRQRQTEAKSYKRMKAAEELLRNPGEKSS